MAQVRLVPKADHYVLEVVYPCEASPAAVDPELFVAADLGVNVPSALVSNKPGFTPRLVNGRPLKATNQFYNKQRAHLQQQQARANRFTSRQLDRLTSDAQPPRPAVVSTRPAVASSSGTVAEGIGTLIIGKNALWKQGVEVDHKHKGGVRADSACAHHPSS